MRTLFVFDIDDTLFFANQQIGMEVEGVFRWITQQEFHEHDIAGTVHPNLDFSKLQCAEDFIANLQPNPIMIQRLKDTLRGPGDVVVMTARHPLDDIPLFKTAFHQQGIETDDFELVFAGISGPAHWSSHQKKAILFKQYLEQHYDHIVIYDDNTSNLAELHHLAMDYITTIESYQIASDGTINRFRGIPIKES